MIRVHSGARVHLGLIAPMAESGRRYGGAGLMLEDPAIELSVEAADELDVRGSRSHLRVADRAAKIARSLLDGVGARIEIHEAPDDHSGLGTGTQLALSLSAALTALRGENCSVAALAERTARGSRSAIGIYGFERGGFLVDEGKLAEDAVAPLATRLPIPESWRFVVVLCTSAQGLSGRTEREAFANLRDTPEISARLRALIDDGLVPAVQRGDASEFGQAMSEYGRRAGEVFRGVQGGVFASERIAAVIDAALRHGALGATQSSWGPAVCALVEDEERASALASRLREGFGLGPNSTIVTCARNRGAELTADGRTLSLW